MTDQYTPRRRWPRLPVVVECRIEGLSGQAEARLTELSVAGGYVDTKGPFRTGDRVRFVFLLDGTEVEAAGRVIYTHTGIGFGFAFELDEMTPSARQRIAEFLGHDGTENPQAE